MWACSHVAAKGRLEVRALTLLARHRQRRHLAVKIEDVHALPAMHRIHANHHGVLDDPRMMRATKKDAYTDGCHETVALLLAPAAIGKNAGSGCAVIRIDAAGGFQGGRLVRSELGVVLSLELILFGEVLDGGLPAVVGEGRGELLNRHGCHLIGSESSSIFLHFLRKSAQKARWVL